MARILGVTEVHLGRLSKSGDVPAPIARGRWDVIATVQGFVSYKVGAAKPGEVGDAKSEDLLLVIERRRKTAADADAAERENAIATGELHPSSVCAAKVGMVLARVRTRLLAIPAMFAPAAHRTRSVPELEAIMRGAIDEALHELCAIDQPGDD